MIVNLARGAVLAGAVLFVAASASAHDDRKSQPPPPHQQPPDQPNSDTIWYPGDPSQQQPQPPPQQLPPPGPAAQQQPFTQPPAAGSGDGQFCVDEVNRIRAQYGKPPVVRSATLETYATEGAREDHGSRQAHGHFSRTSGGSISFAENECPGWGGWSLSQFGSVQGIMHGCFADMMKEGPPPPGGFNHYSNMLSDNDALGCGIYSDGQTVTVVQDFGQR